MSELKSIQTYLNNANRLLQTRNAREHSYRGDLQQLLNDILNDKDVIVTNEPARIVNVGTPDYSITKNNIPIGHIEAKDINKPLDSKEYKEQFDRYKNALPNLIITDYLDFWFYKNGMLTIKISIAKIENYSLFANNIKDFTAFKAQTITSPLNLAKLMAGKARLLEDVLEKAILSDDENNDADVYAQTIAYGMFAARLHDKTLENFSRQEAVFLIPKTNPFLRGLFSYISGADCDDRIIWIIWIIDSKIDFPRVPYPDPKIFWELVAFGSELRALHLLESDKLNDRVIDIDGESEMIITNKLNKKDATIENNVVTLKLNEDISIINIPLVA